MFDVRSEIIKNLIRDLMRFSGSRVQIRLECVEPGSNCEP